MRPPLERLKEIAGKPKIVRVTFAVKGYKEDTYYGCAVGMSRSLLVLQRLSDFHLDGYSILRLKDIVKVNRGRTEQTFDKILRNLGVFEEIGLPPWLKFGSWASALRSLQQQRKCVAIEDLNEEGMLFSLGVIRRLTKDVVYLKDFGNDGQWEKKLRRFNLAEITEVAFDTEYNRVFHEYMKSK